MSQHSCLDCGSAMKSSLENYRYDEAAKIDLSNVKVWRCTSCAYFEVEIVKTEALHQAIAQALADKPAPLLPGQVRWIRTYLGLSSSDFAREMGVEPETVSRWESTTSPQPLGGSADQLIRHLARTGEPTRKYHDSDPTQEGMPLRLALHRGKWRSERMSV